MAKATNKPEETTPEVPAETTQVSNQSQTTETPVTESGGQDPAATGGQTPALTTAAAEPIIKQNFVKAKVTDFRGSYRDAKFDDECVCERISHETLLALKQQFPGAEITVIDSVE